jgi:WD40 repeat protein
LLYSYKPEAADAKNDIKRLQSAGMYQQVGSWSTSSTSEGTGVSSVGCLTALACVNSVHCPLIFAASSDRRLHVLDVSTGKFSRQLESPHERSIHCIALPHPSVHVQASRGAYDLFATAAIDGVVAVWDLRAPTCVSRLSSHVNRREDIQACFSPCLRWLATGSEVGLKIPINFRSINIQN